MEVPSGEYSVYEKIYENLQKGIRDPKVVVPVLLGLGAISALFIYKYNNRFDREKYVGKSSILKLLQKAYYFIYARKQIL